MKRPDLGDGWYEAEESTRLGMISELRRVARRTRVRPIPVLLLAVLITAGVAYRFHTKPRIYEGDVVLALTEGSLAEVTTGGIPFNELREYVVTVLMPDSKLIELIERRDLFRLRSRLGAQWALEQLRLAMEIVIWKNSFVFYHAEDRDSQQSARIGITVADQDPDLAFVLARDIASIVIKTHEEQRRRFADALAKEVDLMSVTMAQQLDALTKQRVQKENALEYATKTGKGNVAAGLMVDLMTLQRDHKRVRDRLALIRKSPMQFADQISAARLDTTLEIVEERRPQRPEQSGIVLIMIIVVIGTGALLGAALFIGAFDSRVHDTDDVARLNLPVLGHVPGFPGDHVGSLHARGAVRRRVPSFLRWRFLR
jgi:hypothetical protein